MDRIDPPPLCADGMTGTTMWKNRKLSEWRTKDHAAEEPAERMSTIMIMIMQKRMLDAGLQMNDTDEEARVTYYHCI